MSLIQSNAILMLNFGEVLDIFDLDKCLRVSYRNGDLVGTTKGDNFDITILDYNSIPDTITYPNKEDAVWHDPIDLSDVNRKKLIVKDIFKYVLAFIVSEEDTNILVIDNDIICYLVSHHLKLESANWVWTDEVITTTE